MSCLCKPIKNQAPKASSVDKARALADRAPQPEPVVWSTYTPGPYLVPFTRWIE
jgi:hypothetical protein